MVGPLTYTMIKIANPAHESLMLFLNFNCNFFIIFEVYCTTVRNKNLQKYYHHFIDAHVHCLE